MNGNGYFIWLLNRIGSPEDVAEKAAASGIKWVALKIADGRSGFNIFKDKGDLVGPFVDSFRRRKVAVWGWHYVYGYYPVDEATIAEKRMKDFGLDGYIIDAEVEYKNKPSQASQFMKELRRRLKVPIAICAYRFPHYHLDFPWTQFLTADVNMPQVYWMQSQNAGQQLLQSYNEFARMTRIPFIPVGAAFSEYGWTPTTQSIADFRIAATNLGLPGYSWWEWYEAVFRKPELFDASTGNTAPPLPAKRLVKTPINDLRCRQQPSLSAPVIGYLTQNKIYSSSKTSGAWYSIDEMGGWAHSGYLKVM